MHSVCKKDRKILASLPHPGSEIMPKTKDLTIKQRKFLDVYIQTGNASEAAMQSYDVKDRTSARAIGTENLAKLSNVVRHIMEERGLTLPSMVDTVKEAQKAMKWNDFTGEREPDHNARLKAVTIASKWLNVGQSDNQTNIQVNVNPILGGRSVSSNNSNTEVTETE